MEISEITVLIYLCSRSIMVDVSYDSVLGDIVGTGDGLRSECVSSSSLVSVMVFFSSACIVLQFSLAYITLRGGLARGQVRIGWCNI